MCKADSAPTQTKKKKTFCLLPLRSSIMIKRCKYIWNLALGPLGYQRLQHAAMKNVAKLGDTEESSKRETPKPCMPLKFQA